jgi:hypothetical protein
MALQGPLVVVAENPAPELIDALAAAGAFPLVETDHAKAAAAIAAAKPSAIVLDARAADDAQLAQSLSQHVTSAIPIIPVIACVADGATACYREALPVSHDATPQTIAARVSSALRVRSLHASVLRRAAMARDDGRALPEAPASDPLDDATVVVAGRARSYPALGMAIGETCGVIGVLSIEAAARYLKARDADGLLIGDGFHPRNVEALLTVLAEDSRFRDLPIGVLGKFIPGSGLELLHLVQAGEPAALTARILPLVRLHAFEARLRRIMHSFDTEGVIDPDTGLLYVDAFTRDLDRALREAGERGTGLSVARFSFDVAMSERAGLDAARLVSRLVRGADFACRDDDGSVLVAFTETDLRHAHVVARRIASVLKHTMLAPGQGRAAIAPAVTLAARKGSDNAASLIARVSAPAVAAE